VVCRQLQPVVRGTCRSSTGVFRAHRRLFVSAAYTVTVTCLVLHPMHAQLSTWAAAACNNPIFAEIVPPDARNLIYAFDRSFEGAISVRVRLCGPRTRAQDGRCSASRACTE
jgi:hypothetical protein